MATNPDDIKKGYLAWRQQQMDNRLDNNRFAQQDDRSGLENAGRGVMSGLAQSGYGTLGTVGKLLSVAGGQNVGGALQKYAHDNAQEAEEYYDPHGTAGRLGEGGGKITGDAATFMAGGEALGGEKLAAKGAAAFPRLLGGASGSAALHALPGALADASIHGLTARPNSDDPGFFKTLRNDELGAGAVGGAFGMVRGGAQMLGRVGSKLLGKLGGDAGEEVGSAIGSMPPAPPQAPAPEAVAPVPEAPNEAASNGNGPVSQKWPAGSPKVTQVGAAPADFETQVKAAMAEQAAPVTPTQEAATPSTLSEQAPAPQPAAPTKSPAPPKKTRVQTEAPKPTEAQAPAEAKKPAVAAKKGSEKGGKAKATPVESNSGTGAQGAPTASKSAPAKKPAASKSPAATPDATDDLKAKIAALKAENAAIHDKVVADASASPTSTPTPRPEKAASAAEGPPAPGKAAATTPVTRKNAVAERKGRIAPIAAKGGLTPEESTRESDNDSWLKTARQMHAGLSESKQKTKLAEQIAKAEAENAAFAAKRKGQ